MPRPTRLPVSGPAAESARGVLEPRAWHGVLYRPCPAGAGEVRRLFQFAGAWAPAVAPDELAWEAEADGRLLGGVLVERHGEHGFIHGPVVVDPRSDAEPLEVAAQLLAASLAQAASVTMTTLFARPQGLDRIWVRAGLLPVPEATLPPALRARPGTGLYAWRRPGSYQIAAPATDAAQRRGRR